MKKFCMLLAVLVLALALGLAQAESYRKADPEATALYDSEWVSEEAWMDIAPQDGELKVQILKTTEYPEGLCWEYTGELDPETKALKAVRNAAEFRIMYREEAGYDITETLYEGPADASFTIGDDGRLLWHDGRANAGEGIAFTKIGRFNDTTWVCDRASIEIAWQDEGYKVFVQWGSSAWENTEWDYSCYYDAATNTLTALPFGVKTELTYDDSGNVTKWDDIYTDGEATFRLDGNGRLLWEDAKEDAGKGMAFEEVTAQ